MEQPTGEMLILVRMEVKLDQLISTSSDHEVRLRRLEARRWPLPVVSTFLSVGAVVAAFAPMVVGK